MSTWQGAWFLAREELRRVRWRHLITVIFIAYVLFFTIAMFDDAMNNQDGSRIYWAMDFLIVALLPCLGLMSTQSSGFYWRTDSYTKRLISWRMLPISIRQIALGRLMTFLTLKLTSLLLFFLLFHMGTFWMNGALSVGAFVWFALFWSCYAVVFGVLYIYFELGFTGKQYLWFCLIMSLFLMSGVIVYSILSRKSLFVTIYLACASGGAWIGMTALAAAVLAVWFGFALIARKLRKRDLSR